MKRKRSFKGIRIKVEVGPVQICSPKTGTLIAAVQTRDEPYMTRRIRLKDGRQAVWLVVQGSRFGGLPLHAAGNGRSWELAWQNAQIEILVPVAGRWLPIQEWSEIDPSR